MLIVKMWLRLLIARCLTICYTIYLNLNTGPVVFVAAIVLWDTFGTLDIVYLNLNIGIACSVCFFSSSVFLLVFLSLIL